jgi:L-aminopeptidase/D-esterase-like protein
VRPEHAIAALDDARGGPLAEGAVGGGTGMTCYGFKGGSGTASRRVRMAVAAETMIGRDDHRSPGLAHGALVELLSAAPGAV